MTSVLRSDRPRYIAADRPARPAPTTITSQVGFLFRCTELLEQSDGSIFGGQNQLSHIYKIIFLKEAARQQFLSVVRSGFPLVRADRLSIRWNFMSRLIQRLLGLTTWGDVHNFIPDSVKLPFP